MMIVKSIKLPLLDDLFHISAYFDAPTTGRHYKALYSTHKEL